MFIVGTLHRLLKKHAFQSLAVLTSVPVPEPLVMLVGDDSLSSARRKALGLTSVKETIDQLVTVTVVALALAMSVKMLVLTFCTVDHRDELLIVVVDTDVLVAPTCCHTLPEALADIDR